MHELRECLGALQHPRDSRSHLSLCAHAATHTQWPPSPSTALSARSPATTTLTSRPRVPTALSTPVSSASWVPPPPWSSLVCSRSDYEILNRFPFLRKKPQLTNPVSFRYSPRCRLRYRQVRHWYRCHVRDAPRPHHEEHHSRGDGWYVFVSVFSQFNSECCDSFS